MKGRVMTCFSTRFRSVSLVAAFVAVAFLAGSVGPVRAQASWNTKYDEIHRMYYNLGKKKEAIQALEDQIEAAGNSYSDDVLSKILKMVKEYFAISQDTAGFERLVFNMFEPNRIDEIVDEFKGTRMYESAKKAKNNWLRPTAASLSIDADELDVGDETAYRVSATNQKKKAVSARGLTVTATPPDYVRVESGRIVALQSGTVTISVTDADGNPLASRPVNIREGLNVTITPDYKQLEIGKSEDFVIQSNKTFDKFQVKTVFDPPGLVTGSEFPVEAGADKKRIRVTAKNAGTVLLKATDAGGATLSHATIYVPPKAPSKLYPLVGTVVTVGVGVYSFILRGSANDKFDEHVQCINDLPPGATDEQQQPCLDLHDDYQSKLTLSGVGFVVTGVAAVGTGYLWYKYFKAKKAYNEKLNAGTKPISLRVDAMTGRVAFTYNF